MNVRWIIKSFEAQCIVNVLISRISIPVLSRYLILDLLLYSIHCPNYPSQCTLFTVRMISSITC